MAYLTLESITNTLHFSNPASEEQINVSFVGSAHEYHQDAWFRGLRGVYRHYRSISGKITLNVGSYYKAETAKIKVTFDDHGINGTEGYKCRAETTFNIPAPYIVPHIEISPADPNFGTIPYEVSCALKITGVFATFTGQATNTLYITYSGNIDDYLLPTPPIDNGVPPTPPILEQIPILPLALIGIIGLVLWKR